MVNPLASVGGVNLFKRRVIVGVRNSGVADWEPRWQRETGD